ncbi:MAG: DMT family transporter [Bacteroidales bacterium]|nr:DMT family transporter [Bacteroidales bacterium]
MKKFRGLLLAMLASATFGFIPLFSIPLLNRGIDLDSVCFYRFAFASFFMWLICKIKRVKLDYRWKELGAMALLSIFYAATSFFLTASYKYISSGTATTIHFFYPVVVALAMMLFFREKVSIWKVIAIAAGVAGVFFLSGGVSGEKISLTGLILVLVTVITYPAYLVGVNRTPVVMKMDGMKQTLLVLGYSAIIFFINVMVKGAHFTPLTTGEHWIYALCLAIIPTLVSDFALIYAIQLAGSTITAILGCMEPLVAVICGVIFFGEAFTYNSLLGMILVFAAVFIIIIVCSREKRAEKS